MGVGASPATRRDVRLPFAFSDGTCEFCERGLHTVCKHGGFWAMENDGGQGEAIRAPLADGTLFPVPQRFRGDEAVLTALFPLTDVMGTGTTQPSAPASRKGAPALSSAMARWGSARFWPRGGSVPNASS